MLLASSGSRKTICDPPHATRGSPARAICSEFFEISHLASPLMTETISPPRPALAEPNSADMQFFKNEQLALVL